jgi:hypothetical protein
MNDFIEQQPKPVNDDPTPAIDAGPHPLMLPAKNKINIFSKDGMFLPLAILIVLVAIAAVLVVLHPWQRKNNASSQTANSTVQQKFTDTLPTNQVIVYAEEVSGTATADRYWPTVNIFKRVGGDNPETIAQNIGKVGEYPSGSKLSPNKLSLAINLRSKIQLVNVKTKALKDLFVPKYQVESIIFSQDSKSLLVWDQVYPTGKSYRVVKIDIATGSPTVIREGAPDAKWPYGFYLNGWRSDNRVIMSRVTGSEFTEAYFMDLSTKTISIVPNTTAVGSFLVSDSANVMALPSGSIEDTCNAISSSSSNEANYIDSATGTSKYKLVDTSKHLKTLTFKADASEVLVAKYTVGAKPITPDSSECNDYYAHPEYYLVNLTSGTQTKLSDPTATLYLGKPKQCWPNITVKV